MEIVLASGSPRRRALLDQLGVRFRVRPADVDETPLPGERPEALVARLSDRKARAVFALEPDALVLAADTVVVVDGEVLGKPVDDAENRAMLARLAGREHRVLTGHTLLGAAGEERFVVDTGVTMRPLAGPEIGRYVASGEGRDKAGGYAIQGRGAALVRGVAGCYFNVVGMSVAAVVEAAQRLGVVLV